MSRRTGWRILRGCGRAAHRLAPYPRRPAPPSIAKEPRGRGEGLARSGRRVDEEEGTPLPAVHRAWKQSLVVSRSGLRRAEPNSGLELARSTRENDQDIQVDSGDDRRWVSIHVGRPFGSTDRQHRPAYREAVVRVGPAGSGAIARSYPRNHEGLRIGGTVRVRFLVDAEGNVSSQSVDIIAASSEVVADAAARAVTNIQFVPGKRDGSATSTLVEMPIRYVVH